MPNGRTDDCRINRAVRGHHRAGLALARAAATAAAAAGGAIVLRYYEDLTEAQTAEVLSCSVGTVKSQVSVALKKLRARLGDDAVLLDKAGITDDRAAQGHPDPRRPAPNRRSSTSTPHRPGDRRIRRRRAGTFLGTALVALAVIAGRADRGPARPVRPTARGQGTHPIHRAAPDVRGERRHPLRRRRDRDRYLAPRQLRPDRRRVPLRRSRRDQAGRRRDAPEDRRRRGREPAGRVRSAGRLGGADDHGHPHCHPGRPHEPARVRGQPSERAAQFATKPAHPQPRGPRWRLRLLRRRRWIVANKRPHSPRSDDPAGACGGGHVPGTPPARTSTWPRVRTSSGSTRSRPAESCGCYDSQGRQYLTAVGAKPKTFGQWLNDTTFTAADAPGRNQPVNLLNCWVSRRAHHELPHREARIATSTEELTFPSN